MSNTFGISGAGRDAEERFRLLTGALKPPSASQGDAVLEGHLVEVKGATSVTLNQVRAVKYIPLVVLFSNDWYVVPAHAIVAAVSLKVRGQHTENPFESATLNLNNLGRYKLDAEARLRDVTLEAIRESEQFPELQEAMKEVLRESKRLADSSRQKVREILQRPAVRN